MNGKKKIAVLGSILLICLVIIPCLLNKLISKQTICFNNKDIIKLKANNVIEDIGVPSIISSDQITQSSNLEENYLNIGKKNPIANILTKNREKIVYKAQKVGVHYQPVTIFKYDAKALFEMGGSVTDIDNQGIYFTDQDEVPGISKFPLSSWNRWDSKNPKDAVTGLVENELDENGNIVFTKPAYGIFDESVTQGKEIYTNVGIPMELLGNGFYSFKSNEKDVYFENGIPKSNTNLLAKEGKTEYTTIYNKIVTGFFPFNVPVPGEGIYHFGMHAKIPFYMTKDGKTDRINNDEDIVFDFSGDDDVWIFIDGKLVIDIGGIHDEISADINFATGIVNTYKGLKSTNVIAKTENIVDILGSDWNSDLTKEHQLDIFFLERGGGSSNFSTLLNMPKEVQHSNIIVHHYIEGTTEKVPSNDGGVVEDEVKIGVVGEAFTTQPSDNVSENYEYVSSNGNTSGTYTETMQEVTYFYREKNFNYTVQYYYDGVKDDKKTEVLSAKYQDEITSYTDKVEDGYELEKTENLPLTISDNNEENIINVYYVRKDATCIVKYVDKMSGEEISEEVIKTGKVFDKYDVAKDEKKIEGYTLIEKPSPTTGTFTEETQTKTFYYTKNTQIKVKYLEKDTNTELASEEIIPGYIGKEYTTTVKDIANYTFIESTNNTTGKMTEEPITVIYYYLQNTKVVINYIDKNTGAVLKTVEETGKVGDEYTASAKNFEGYVLKEKPTQETVTMTKEVITLNYYYVKVSAGVVEKHINFKSNQIIENTLYSGNEGDAYTTTSKTFEGYDIVTNIMYYTEYVITHPEILSENGVSTVDELIEKLGLEANNAYIPLNYTGLMKTDLIEVNYYYIKKTSVIVQYIDKITGELLEKETVYTGHEGDAYKTTSKKFEGYDIIKEEYPSNSTGTMKESTERVKYYYIHKANVIEKHIDINTGKLLEKETIYSGHEGENYVTSSKEFEKYDLVKEKLPENATGTMKRETIEVEYYYIRKAQVIEKHIDEETDELIEEATIYAGHEGNSYKTSSKEFKGYELNKEKLPENAEGTMTVTVKEDGTIDTTIIVNYYYKKIKEIQKPIEIEKDDNKDGSIINNIYNTITNNTNNTSSAKTPNTGDMTPVIAISTIALIILLNVIQLEVEKVAKRSRIQKSIINSKASNAKKILKKSKGKKFKE